MVAPRQMFDHHLEVLKGWLPDDMTLDHTGKISANVTVDPVWAGRVVHLNVDGEFELGCTGHEMPIFLRHNSNDLDVQGAHGTDDQNINAVGWISGLAPLGGFEFATSEYDPDQDYEPNDLLRAPALNNDATQGGRLTNQGVVEVASATPQLATCCVGCVSTGAFVNHNRIPMLAFWPIYLPGAAGL